MGELDSPAKPFPVCVEDVGEEVVRVRKSAGTTSVVTGVSGVAVVALLKAEDEDELDEDDVLLGIEELCMVSRSYSGNRN